VDHRGIGEGFSKLISMIPYIDHRRLKFRSLPFFGFFAEKDEYFLRLLIIKKRLPVKEAVLDFAMKRFWF
tara:strand:+ start:1459 stop:1668 length:210 start_codon:yes stop_codon:yes gene_type:complete